MQEETFHSVMSMGSVTTEEGTILGRNKQPFTLTEALGAAAVNGPVGDKGQYLWMGTYTVKIDRGLTLDNVQHLCGIDGFGSQEMSCLPYGARVAITWLNKNNVQLPVIVNGTTLDFYNKMITSKGTLLDPGEKIIRSSMAASAASIPLPFSNNQFDSPNSIPSTQNANDSSVVSVPGSETFYDKFGRVISLSRTPNSEFLITHGPVDTGQDNVDTYTTVSAQTNYYSQINNDESTPIDKAEPFAPKPINLTQYHLKPVVCKVVGDPDPNRTVTRGILPRFDLWKFNPIVIRKYDPNSDGIVESTTSYSVYQQRSNSSADATTLGYLNTITNTGDQKEFIPRNFNGRVVGDYLMSVGGNYDLKIKTNMLNSDGSVNNKNVLHQTFATDGTNGTYSMLVGEQIDTKKAIYNSTISATVGQVIFIKSGGGTSSDYNLKITMGIDGSIAVDTKSNLTITTESGGTANVTIDGDVNLTTHGKLNLTSTGDCTVKATGNCNVDGAVVNLGKNAASQLVNNLGVCIYSGAPHAVGNTNVKA